MTDTSKALADLAGLSTYGLLKVDDRVSSLSIALRRDIADFKGAGCEPSEYADLEALEERLTEICRRCWRVRNTDTKNTTIDLTGLPRYIIETLRKTGQELYADLNENRSKFGMGVTGQQFDRWMKATERFHNQAREALRYSEEQLAAAKSADTLTDDEAKAILQAPPGAYADHTLKAARQHLNQ